MSFLMVLFKEWWNSLTEPRLFFGESLKHKTTYQSVVFALIISWLAAWVEWLVRFTKNESFLDSLLKVRSQLDTIPVWKSITPYVAPHLPTTVDFPSWAFELFSVLGNPFTTLFSLVVSSFILWLGVWLLIGQSKFSEILKVLAYASTSSKLVGALLSFLPLSLGYALAGMWGLAIQVVGISSYYRVSLFRSFGVLILPSLFITFIIACFIGLILGTIGALLGSLF